MRDREDTVATATRDAARGTLSPGTPIGRFTVVGLLGAGGMGAVYEARDPQLDRSVAIKVLPGDMRREDLHLRLVREAQALAQLQHPNVVGVHEAGLADGRVYVAMERVDGVTLDRHLARRPHAWREIVALFVQAGRGLAAAHAKGLIHRDFKPSNVLVDRDGRVRVGDFGLARLAQYEDGEEATLPGHARGRPAPMSLDDTTLDPGGEVTGATPPLSPSQERHGLLATPLTDASAFLGTPRYMAPEQYARFPATAQSDQFSFAVALWEALFGEHPFAAGDQIGGLAATVSEGKVRPPRRHRAPRRLIQLVARGLRVDPLARHPSMSALVAALEELPLRRRRFALASAGALVAAAAALGAAAATAGDSIDCARSGRELDGVWTQNVRAALATRFAGARPYGADTAGRVATALDTWTARWSDARVDACRATHERGEQSADLLDRRAACLDRGRLALSSLLSGFASVDGETVDRALDATAALPSPDDCAAARVAADAPPATDPRAVAIEQDLQASATAWNLGRWDEALKRAAAAITAADAHDDPAMRMRARAHHGAVTVEKSYPAARDELHAALAEAARLDDRRTEADIMLALLAGVIQQNAVARIETLLPVTRAAVAASPTQEHRRRFAQLEVEADMAQDTSEDLLPLCERLAAGTSEAEAVKAAECRCAAIARAGRWSDSIEPCQVAVARSEAYYGREHPAVTTALRLLAASYVTIGNFEAGTEIDRRILALRERAYGRQSDAVAQDLASLGLDLSKLNRHDEAVRNLEESLAILQRPGNPPSLVLGQTHIYLANELTEVEGDPDAMRAKAVAHAREGLRVLERLVGAEHRELARTLMTYGNVLNYAGERADALAAFQRGERLAATYFGGSDAMTLGYISMQADVLMNLGRAAEAIAPAERALAAGLAIPDVAPSNLAVLHAVLGAALLEAGQRARGRRELLEARRIAISTGEAGTDTLGEIDALLRKHGGIPAAAPPRTPAP